MVVLKCHGNVKKDMNGNLVIIVCSNKIHGVKFAPVNKPLMVINQRLTLDECQQIADERYGECLSTTEYITSNTKMKWKCKDCFSIISKLSCYKKFRHDWKA